MGTACVYCWEAWYGFAFVGTLDITYITHGIAWVHQSCNPLHLCLICLLYQLFSLSGFLEFDHFCGRAHVLRM